MLRDWIRERLGERPALDERAPRLLRVHDVRLPALGLLREAHGQRRGGLVRDPLLRLLGEAPRASSLGGVRGGRRRLLAACGAGCGRGRRSTPRRWRSASRSGRSSTSAARGAGCSPRSAAPRFGVLALALWRARARFEQPRPPLRERYGEWALVTGASAGIGAAFARAFAARGPLVRADGAPRGSAARARGGARVAPRREDARASASISPRRAARRSCCAAVADLEIAILVNNAGFGGAGRFDKLEPERLRAMVELNCAAPVVLTRALLPGDARARPRRGDRHRLGRGLPAAARSTRSTRPPRPSTTCSARRSGPSSAAPASTASPCCRARRRPSSRQIAGELPHAGEPPEQVVATALDALGRQPSVISGWFNWLRANAASASSRAACSPSRRSRCSSARAGGEALSRKEASLSGVAARTGGLAREIRTRPRSSPPTTARRRCGRSCP